MKKYIIPFLIGVILSGGLTSLYFLSNPTVRDPTKEELRETTKLLWQEEYKKNKEKKKSDNVVGVYAAELKTYERRGIILHFEKSKKLLYVGNTYGYGNRVFQLGSYTLQDDKIVVKYNAPTASAQQILEANHKGCIEFKFKREGESVLMEAKNFKGIWEKKYFDPYKNREGVVLMN